jgi:hypothetical protein
MNPGQPILCGAEDKFERLSFAEHLAGFLCLEKGSPSIVVGIEGKWGDGKTSCINLIKEVLHHHDPRPIIVDYRPWLISTLDSIIEGFFIELASALGTQYKSEKNRIAAHKVLQFGKILSPIKLIPGVEPWGTMVESVLNAVGQSAKAASELASLSISSRKDDLQKSLEKIDRPIVVVIDDIDRLPPEGVRIVFQMLKAVCDFNRVSYLVAYDPDPVTEALSYGQIYDGRRYLEKLVQITYPLPRLSYIRMHDYALSHLNTLMKRYELSIAGDEKERYDYLFNRTDLIRLLVTPRDVTRLCNRLSLSAPNTRDEVCFADLIAFEALELKFPDLTKIIRNEPEEFVSLVYSDKEFFSGDTMTHDMEYYIKQKKEEKISYLSQLIKRIECDERTSVCLESILLFLFPKLGQEDIRTRDLQGSINRICKRDAFLKLLHSGVASFTYSAKIARRFCENPDDRNLILADYRDAGDLFNWIDYLEKIAAGIGIVDETGFCELLFAEVWGPEPERSNMSLARRIGDFLYEIVKTRRNEKVRNKMLSKIASNTVSLSVSEAMLLEFLSEYGIWKSGRYFPLQEIKEEKIQQLSPTAFSYAQLYSAKDIWLNSVRKVAAEQGIMETQKDVLSIMHRWGQLNGNNYQEPQDYIMKHSVDRDWLRKFVRFFNLETNWRDILPFIPMNQMETFIERIREIEEDTDKPSFSNCLRNAREEQKKQEPEDGEGKAGSGVE